MHAYTYIHTYIHTYITYIHTYYRYELQEIGVCEDFKLIINEDMKSAVNDGPMSANRACSWQRHTAMRNIGGLE
jgi:hypothetical protein